MRSQYFETFPKKQKIIFQISCKRNTWNCFVCNLGTSLLKANGRFQITTFDIAYGWNFVKISYLILFGSKSPYLEIQTQNFSKTYVRFEISTLKIGYLRNFVKIRKLILFDLKCPNLRIWAQNFQRAMSDLKSGTSK